MHRNRAIAPLLAATVAALLTACASVRAHLPFGSHPEPAPQPVRELTVQVAENASMPVVLQYWERNTLVVDLQGVPSSGSLRLIPESDVGRWLVYTPRHRGREIQKELPSVPLCLGV
jgi:hypothetical protein